MNITVITSFNKDYYERIGSACVRSWLQHWHADIELHCYVEGFRMEHHPRIRQIDFEDLCDGYRAFQASDLKPRVKTFAKKAYSVMHAMEHAGCDRLVWIDADTITTGPVHITDIEQLCPPQICATFMGVYHHLDRNNHGSPLMFSAETGFFILNTKHQRFAEFGKRYREYYDQRLQQGLRRFYDGEVFGAVIQDLGGGAEFNDLCASLPKAYNSPLRQTSIGRFLIHHKSKHSKEDFVAAKTD